MTTMRIDSILAADFCFAGSVGILAGAISIDPQANYVL